VKRGRSLRRLARCEDGQSMVEFAVFFPIMLLLVMGIIEFALLINAHQIVQYSAFTASRAYAVYYPDTNKAKENAKRSAAISCLAISPNLTGFIPGGATFRTWVEQVGLENMLNLVDKLVVSYATTVVDCSAENIGHDDCLNAWKDPVGLSGKVQGKDYYEIKVEVSHWYNLKFPVVNMLAEFVSDNYFMTGQHGTGYQSGDVFGIDSLTEQAVNWLAGFVGMKFIQIKHSCIMGSEWPYGGSSS